MGVLKRTVRGIRDSIPAGYIVGRLSAGDGAAELIDLKSLSQATNAAIAGGGGGSGALSGKPADFGVFFSGQPGANQLVFEFQLTRNIILSQNLAGSQFGANTAPTADYTLTLKRNGTTIGTIVLHAVGSPTITFASTITLLVGDKFQIVGQASPDTTLADVFFSFQASFQ